jgi:fatty-acid peroxygenase
MFMSLMSPQRIQQIVNLARTQWRLAAQTWAKKEQVVLYDEMRESLYRVVCAWTGIPLEEFEVQHRTCELTVLFADAAHVGLSSDLSAHW